MSSVRRRRFILFSWEKVQHEVNGEIQYRQTERARFERSDYLSEPRRDRKSA